METALTLPHAELLHVEERLWVLSAPAGIANYDFRFNEVFRCALPWQPPEDVVAVARLGAITHYDFVYTSLKGDGITLLHTPEEHLRASELPRWYPILEDLTPRSIWFAGHPDTEMIAAKLGWPIFMKGTRQTSGHRRALSVIENAAQMASVLQQYAADPILRWQGVVCRQHVRLRLVEDAHRDRLPSAFEFRTFWWKGEFVGCGRYWWDGKPYRMTASEKEDSLTLAREAARRVAVPFLVVDVAQAEDGSWLVIECNDGQESGYAGISPLSLWQRILDLER